MPRLPQPFCCFMKFALIITACLVLAHAGTVPHGGNCSIANIRLDTATHKFLTDCDDTTFCTPQNTCQPKQCRRDEFPFGYPPNVTLPPFCPKGQYCPDDGSACAPWLALGQACQLNRDDECAPPQITTAEASKHQMNINAQSPMKVGENTTAMDIPICLHFMCMYANATLGAPCVIDTTVYIGLGPQGSQYSTEVIRDNCRRPGLFCSASVCMRALDLGQPCRRDQECMSHTCNIRNVCANPPATPVTVPAWQYVLTGVAVAVAMFMTCVILTLVHKRHRRLRHAEVREYYREQLGYRKSIIALHSVALSTNRTSSAYGKQQQASLGSMSTGSVYGRCIEEEPERAREKWRDE